MHTINTLRYWQVLARHHHPAGPGPRAATRGGPDRGAVSTEMAVVTAAFVAIAIAAGTIFMSRAESNANNIPAQVNPPAATATP